MKMRAYQQDQEILPAIGESAAKKTSACNIFRQTFFRGGEEMI